MRCWSGASSLPAVDGPVLVGVRGDDLVDLSRGRADVERAAEPRRSGRGDPRRRHRCRASARSPMCLRIPPRTRRAPASPWLLAPCDLQAIKAAGVTFVASMLERVIEEQARGDPAKAESVRRAIVARHRRRPRERAARFDGGGAPQGRADRAGRVVAVPRGRASGPMRRSSPSRSRCRRWAPAPRSASIRSREWNNPEPEIVLAVNSRGRTVGRHAGQRRQPARLRRPQRAAARQGQGQQRVVRDRAVHPAVRRALQHRRRAQVRARDARRRARTASRSTARARSR